MNHLGMPGLASRIFSNQKLRPMINDAKWIIEKSESTDDDFKKFMSRIILTH